MEINNTFITEERVLSKIYLVRGLKVMMDSDLAELYQVETRALNQQVKRNKERFPEDFMFQLSDNEFNILMSQIVTSKTGKGGVRKPPYVFTEHGVLMLSSVLNSKRAIQVNIEIMRIFTKVRQMLMDNSELRIAIDELRRETDSNSKSIEKIFDQLDKFIIEKQLPMTKVGYQMP